MTRIQELYQKYQDDTLSEKETAELLNILKRRPSEEWNIVLEPLWRQYQASDKEWMPADIHGKIWQQLAAETEQPMSAGTVPQPPARIRTMPVKRWLSIAAACLLVIASVYLLTKKPAHNGPSLVAQSVVKPGTDKAILKLANGREILLADASKGELAEQDGMRIVKLDSGRLAYQGAANGPAGYNTLTTPRGGQFRIELPDGSRVWLNSSSSLRYPAGFTGTERKVELTGEAYFEIAKNTASPFNVLVHRKDGEMNVQVLGTTFDIMAYEDEETVNTTLVNGSVKVSAEKGSALIQPGQQASLPAGKSGFVINRPDLGQVLAWKEGKFSFDHADIKAIMRQVARWYDVEIEYQGAVPNNGFFGSVSRQENVQQLLEILQESGGVHLTLKDNKIIVTP